MKHSEIRRIFFDYFTRRDHHKVLSAPLVPAKDPTLLFTNAGMNQFKGVFLQEEKREYNKAVSIQKCMRVSGKHNDFDEVGKTEFHHTFFEMMGNFSFGDYFKERAIEYGWDLLTNHYQFRPDDLWVTVFREDDEAFRIWENSIGVPTERIIRLDEKDNFWQMGDTGPCGPCSEIHFDRGDAHGPRDFRDGNRRFVEVWNLVFMQFYRDETGRLTPLPAPSIDTGMGMERVTAMLQGVKSNYETDLFRPIIEFTAELAGIDPSDPSHRVDLNVVADHARALSFLISDGVLPANDGRGYVLRRVLRRAAKHGKAIGLAKSFLSSVSARVIENMKEFYPELEFNRHFIKEVLDAEEERFNHTLANGLKRFEDLLQKTIENKTTLIPGDELFKLSDTYGFPLDFAVDLANEKDLHVDYTGYHEALEKQKEKSRLGMAEKQKSMMALENIEQCVTDFTGRQSLEEDAVITALYMDNKPVTSLPAQARGIVVLDKTPCYAESGGQTGDTGIGQSPAALFAIEDTRKVNSGAFLHHVSVQSGTLNLGDEVHIRVDARRRLDIIAHHSCTHLLHAALRETLGLHVKQSGSYVGPDKLRFDFTHFKPLSPQEIEQVETIVNAKIRENLPIHTDILRYEQAIERGAMAIFEEKYSDVVRMLSMGDFSRELCGGIHLSQTGQAGIFKITGEYSISSGIRRIEALAGEPAYHHVRQVFDQFRNIQNHFRQNEDKLFDYLLNLEKALKEKEKEIKKQQLADKKPAASGLEENTLLAGDVPLTVIHLENADRKQLSTLADEIKIKNKGVAILSTNTDGKSAIIISIDKSVGDRLNASILAKQIAALTGGSGGGRPDFAQAGGAPIDDALNFKKAAVDIITGQLKK